MDNLIEPSRAPRPRLENLIVEAFCEDAPPTQNRRTAEPARSEHEHDAPASDRQIRQASMISTVDAARKYATGWACAVCARRTYRNDRTVAVTQRVICGKPRRDQF
jgi:hypothetical protein